MDKKQTKEQTKQVQEIYKRKVNNSRNRTKTKTLKRKTNILRETNKQNEHQKTKNKDQTKKNVLTLRYSKSQNNLKKVI